MNVNTNNNANDELLVKYLLGEATDAEQREVTGWIEAEEANRKYFEGFKLIWDESRHLASQTVVDEGAAWERFTQRVEREESAPAPKTIPLRPFNFMRIAAALILLAVGGWFVFYLNGPKGNEMLTAQSGSGVLIDTLPDGSVVTLNKNSTLTYPAKFKGDTRQVTLTGEAFFNVAHDKSKPFIVDAGNAEIKVVGTSFNVKASQVKTEIIVETGIVEVAKKQNKIRVVHNQKAIVSQDKAAPEMEGVDDVLYNYYRTKEFVCNSTPLSKLTAVLGEAYDVNITVERTAMKDTLLTTTFHDEPLDDILKVVAATLNLQIERKGKNIILK